MTSYVITEPQIMTAVATDLEEIGSAISAAHTTAAGPTSGLLAPAADEVSAAITNLFGAYSREYHAVVKQAAAFHNEFTRALAAGVHRPAGARVPRAVLRVAFGTDMTDELVLASQRVVPAKLAAAGFAFAHPDLAAALAAVVAPTPP